MSSYVDLVDETICALITAPGPSGISVLRVSGPKALLYTRQHCSFLPNNPESHKVYFGNFMGKDGELVDEVLVTYFAKGRSFTGDETLEVSTHGGFFPSHRALMELTGTGCRPAERGEFSFRSFYNGKIDLLQAEGILSIIESKSDTARAVAVRQLKGNLSHTLHGIEEGLINVLAQLEAAIDFSTEDIQPSSLTEIATQLLDLDGTVQELLLSYKRGKVIHDGVNIVIAGPPNAGKSSIYNVVLGQNKAIVTDTPGTTRDLLESSYKDLGLPIQLMDSAGLREAEDSVEKIGIEKTRDALKAADAVFFTLDMSKYRDQDLRFLEPIKQKCLFIFNKLDLCLDSQVERDKAIAYLGEQLNIHDMDRLIFVSAKNSTGIQELRVAIQKVSLVDINNNEAVITQYRHFDNLSKCSEHMKRAISLCKSGDSYDLIALETQICLKEIFSLLGKEFNDQVLDQVFKKFCLGK
jgi:tRNA modification GTPase